MSFETDQYMNEKDDDIEISDLVSKYPEIKIALPQKYFLSLTDSDLTDSTLAYWNANRSIRENNLDIFKEIMTRFPNTKPFFSLIKSIEIYDYVVSIKGELHKDDINDIKKNAIKYYDNELFDRVVIANFNKQDEPWWLLIAIVYDNLYAYKKFYEFSNELTEIDIAVDIDWILARKRLLLDTFVDLNTTNILEYILEMVQPTNMTHYTYESILKDLVKGSKKDYNKILIRNVVHLLDLKGFLDRDFVKDFIIKNNALELLEFISFDSRTALEITSNFEDAIE